MGWQTMEWQIVRHEVHNSLIDTSASSVVLASVFALGILLSASVFLWPRPRGVRTRSRRAAAVRERLAQAGMHSVSPPAFMVVSVLFAVAFGSITFVVVPIVVVAILSTLAAAVLPLIIVSRRARLRQRATRLVWPDAVDHLVSAVRAGMALPDCLSTLAHTGPPLLKAQFATFERRYRSTGNFAVSLDALKAGLADPVADRILETLRMSREVGGSELTTVLRGLAAFLRQETAIRLEIESRQSWVLNSARLGVAAPWIVLLLLSTRPEAAAAYNTGHGSVLIVVGLVVSLAAYRIMVVIGQIPAEARWFS